MIRKLNTMIVRAKITIQGAVQGVGFRPFIYRLAVKSNLKGWVINSLQGVLIEVEGEKEKLEDFILKLQNKHPPCAKIYSLESSFLNPLGYKKFKIKTSKKNKKPTTIILPDIAVCKDCQRETFDSSNRRFLYPFTNCTNCGPRFTIIKDLPYDRPNTSMRFFKMCSFCAEEYSDPFNRRFHAQPIACPKCGPNVSLIDKGGKLLEKGGKAIEKAVKRVRKGEILAMKGLGGFILLADARDEKVVLKLRAGKNRKEKPFALMFPSFKMVKKYCKASSLEERLLASAESPIVLLRKRPKTDIAFSVSPDNPYLGVMLPYTPLHSILMSKLSIPVVATSGNLACEPIIADDKEAVRKLACIADGFLTHNRPIVRRMDDTVARIVLGKELVLRRARGYAPLPIQTAKRLPKILAVGGHLKNTVAFSLENKIFLSQHIGDLESAETYRVFLSAINDFKRLYKFAPKAVACDLHPDYLSARYAEGLGLPIVKVQHHHAHIASCMAENKIKGEVLGVAWDGTGWGLDNTVWGGEFLTVTCSDFERIARFKTFPLLGSQKAVKDPRRAALGLLFSYFGSQVWQMDKILKKFKFSPAELNFFKNMLEKRINCPLTSSAGRIFDAVSAILGLSRFNSFEGQAAMLLEFAAEPENGFYPFQVSRSKSLIVDLEKTLQSIFADLEKGESIGKISSRFHNTLSLIILESAKLAGIGKVVLSGGVFQNKYLLEKTAQLLEENHFQVYTHKRVPPNDGGISVGQAMVAAAKLGG